MSPVVRLPASESSWTWTRVDDFVGTGSVGPAEGGAHDDGDQSGGQSVSGATERGLHPLAPEAEQAASEATAAMMEDSPQVSVVIPTYNRLPFLREAIASVRAQTFEKWELIVVDDGSTDGTVRWLEGLDDLRIRPVPLDHTGDIAALRNRGVHDARAPLVAFLDSDDLWMSRKLELQVEALRRSAEARWSYTAMRRMDRDGKEILDSRIRPWRPYSGWILPELLTFQALVDTPTLLVERDLLLEIGCFDPRFGSYVTDYELIFRMGLASPAVAVERPLTWIRVHGGAHSGDRVAAYRGWSRLYDSLSREMPTRSLRRICGDEARSHRLTLAAKLAAFGRGWEALSEVGAVLVRRPWTLRGWRILVRQLLARQVLATLGIRRDGTERVK